MLIHHYFNYIYTPLYDFTTARLSTYEKLHHACLDSLKYSDGDRILCVGVGTGNEIVRIFEKNPRVNITGVDYASAALAKAVRKGRKRGIDLTTEVMDARSLRFDNDRFDTVICIHVTDFISDDRKVTEEIIRVTRPNGHFVITFPSDQENVGLGFSLIRSSFSSQTGKNRFVSFFGTLVRTLASIAYLPLVFRRHRKTYTADELSKMLDALPGISFTLEELGEYRDHIVHGKKH